MDFIKNFNNDFLNENHIKKLNEKKLPNLTLYKYSKDKSNFGKKEINQARGIILNDNNDIICYSLNKFNNKDNKDNNYFNKYAAVSIRGMIPR